MTQGKIGLMLDVESLDLGPRAVLLQVGIIAFPLDDPETEMRRVDQYLPVQPQIALGRSVSWDTIRWWIEQAATTPKIQERFIDNSGNDMDELTALVRSVHRKLTEIIDSVGRANVELWAKGPQFDVVNLETLFADCGLDTPWPYDCVMDLRTTMRLAGVSSKTGDIDTSGIVPHVAISDSQFQIRCYVEAMKRLRSND
jgi:hypothetical protein